MYTCRDPEIDYEIARYQDLYWLRWFHWAPRPNAQEPIGWPHWPDLVRVNMPMGCPWVPNSNQTTSFLTLFCNVLYFSPPARWGSLDFNNGATPSPSPSPGLLLLTSASSHPPPLPARRDCGHQVIASSRCSPGPDIARSGCCELRLDPNTCQRECQIEC